MRPAFECVARDYDFDLSEDEAITSFKHTVSPRLFARCIELAFDTPGKSAAYEHTTHPRIAEGGTVVGKLYAGGYALSITSCRRADEVVSEVVLLAEDGTELCARTLVIGRVVGDRDAAVEAALGDLLVLRDRRRSKLVMQL